MERLRRRRCWRGFSIAPGGSQIFWLAAWRRILAKSYGLGGGAEFILEGDEYETAFWDRGPTFFHYHPDDLIITSLEFDHADIYANFETYELAFRRLVNLVPRKGAGSDLGRHRKSQGRLWRGARLARLFVQWETYGFSGGKTIGSLETLRWMTKLPAFGFFTPGQGVWRIQFGGNWAAQRIERHGSNRGGARERDQRGIHWQGAGNVSAA